MNDEYKVGFNSYGISEWIWITDLDRRIHEEIELLLLHDERQTSIFAWDTAKCALADLDKVSTQPKAAAPQETRA